jgi:hypothetical protein
MGSPDLDKNLEGMIQLFTQGQGLAGLDKKRPLGVTLTTDGLQFQPLIVLPVTDLKQLLTALEGLVGAAEEGENGVYQLDVFNQQIFVKEHKTWAYLSMAPDVLDNLPNDGGAMFDGLEKSYDIAGRLHVQNVPEQFRTMIVDQLRLGVESGLARQPDETDEAFDGRKKLVESQIESLTSVINELEQLTLGIALDPAAKTAHVDLAFKALPGSKSARQFAKAKMTRSNFAGFLVPDAAASLNVSTQLEKGDTEQFTSGLEALRSQALEQIKLPDEASKKLADEVVGEVFDVIKATFETGKIDAGATFQVTDKSMTLVVGAYAADSKKVTDALKKLEKLGEKDPNFPKISFDASEHAGVSFHTATIPVPAGSQLAQVVGDKLDVAVGVGADSVYLALGNDCVAKTKSLIDASKAAANKDVLPFQANVALAPVLKLASAFQPAAEGSAEDTLKPMLEDLAKVPGKDHVKLEFLPEPNGAKLRLSAEEGVLMLLGRALQNAQASGAIPGLGP